MANSEKTVLFFELIILEIILGFAIWLPSQASQYHAAKVAGLFIGMTSFMHLFSEKVVRQKLFDFGIMHTEGIASALKLLLSAVAFAGLGYFVLKIFGKNTHFDSHDTRFYPIWSTLQQAGIVLYVWPRLQILCRDQKGALTWMCAMYASFHLPNLALMVLVCVQMYAFVPVYAELKSVWGLPILAVCHYLVGQTVSQVIPVRILCDNHVGIWYVYDKWYTLKYLAMTCSNWLGLNS